MNKKAFMDQHFERNKNLQATAITAVVCTAVFLIFFYIQWSLPVIEKPLLTEGIEVNLGNSDVGSGDEQPLVPGDPGPESNPDNSPTPSTPTNSNTSSSETPESDEPDATPTNVTKTPKAPVTNNTSTPKNTKPANTTPAEPKPKVVMPKYAGGQGNGGNNKDGYNDSKSQGNDASGIGDKGKSWGSIDGTVYDGPGGTKVKGLGSRRMKPLPNFEDDFSENAKVAVDIIVDVNGNVKPVAINPVGTSTTNKTTRQVAMKRAAEIKFEPNKEAQRGTIILDMRVRG